MPHFGLVFRGMAVERACKPLLEAARQGSDTGTELMYSSWSAVADQLIASAKDDERRVRIIGAGAKYPRASNCVSQAEPMQSPNWAGRNAADQRSIDLLIKGAELSGANFQCVEIPYEKSSLPGSSSQRRGQTESRPLHHSTERFGLHKGDDVLLRLRQ
jgi:hypothetical protein